MKRIVILYGGKSGEHEVSCISAASVVRNLDSHSFQPILIGITRAGRWILQETGLAAKARGGLSPLPIGEGPSVLSLPASGLVVDKDGRLETLGCDAVFPVLHGSFGEDGTVQGFLETSGLAYVGASVLGSAVGMDKEMAKALWREKGLPVLPWKTARRSDLEPARLASFCSSVAQDLGWPAFVKPVAAGSSVGAAKAGNADALALTLAAALEWDERALVEPFCEAREIECAVLGNTGSPVNEPLAFPPGEVVPSHEFYDYEAKYLDPKGARLDVPARIPEEVSVKVRKTAIAAYKALELAGMARVDFFLDKRNGELWLNEVNTIPGFTSISMYPKMCESGGLSYADLLSRLVDLALERHAERSRLRYDR